MAEADPLKFVLELVDKLTDPAKAASKQLGALEKVLKKEETQLQRLQKQMAFMQAQDKVSITAYRNLSDRIADKTGKVADLKQEMFGLSETAASGEHGIAGVVDGLKVLAPVAGAVAIEFEAVKKGFELLAEGEKMAIEAAEAKNETIDMLDALLGGEKAAKSTYAQIEGIQDDVAVSHSRLLDLTRQLTASGVTNQRALVDSVQAIGQVESVLGEAGGSKLQGIVEKAAQTGKFKLDPRKLVGTGITVSSLNEELARRMGKGVKEVEAQLKAGKITAEVGIAALTAVVDKKFGELAKGKTLTFTAQIQRAQDNITKLFQDVDASKLLGGLKDVLSVFDQSTVSGKAMHDVITKVFTSISDIIGNTAPYAKAFFKGLIIAGLQLYIGLKPLLHDLGLLGKDRSGVDGLTKAMSALGIVIRQNAMMFSVLFRAGLMLYRLADFLADLPKRFMTLGLQIVLGFKDGILAGIGQAVGAVAHMGVATVAAFKKIWKIGSPSKLAEEEIAGNVVLGFVQGIDKHAKPANDAVRRLASVTSISAARSAPPRASVSGVAASGNSITVTFAPGAIVINGVPNAEAAVVTLPTVIADVLEQRLLARAGG